VSDIVLQTHGLSKRYKRRWAVHNLNLTVRRGEVFGFLGPNGAGKSTTIRMLLTLVRPTSGHVEMFGKNLLKHRNEVVLLVGGLVESADFYLYLSARRNLQMIGDLRGGVPQSQISRVLETVGLLDRANDRVKTFSHGMRQRLGIAQALLGDPEFIILDEPTSGLDPQGIREVRDLIRQLCEKHGTTVFLSSHLLSEIEQTATHMAIISQGNLVVQGKVRELLDSGEPVVRLEATPPDIAMTVVGQHPSVVAVKANGSSFEITMPLDAVSSLNTKLVEAGVAVQALVPRRSLEEYFIRITEGASDLGPPPARKGAPG
jgi:ABC-type multidrug transport system ATPase subunit